MGRISNEPVEVREHVFKGKFERVYNNFEYYAGFINTDSKFKMKCKLCGYIQERNATCVRHIKNIQCDNCVCIDRANRNELKKKELENKKAAKKEEAKRRNENNRIHSCKCNECNRLFTSHRKGKKYCSKECNSKRNNRVKEINRRMVVKINGLIDFDITLDKLIKRDNNTCYICGRICNGKDYTVTKEDYFITGNTYPSIDHVIAIKNGGTHTWDNVRLAHRRCNSIKRDKRIIETAGQLIMIV